jgi:hypothetical protein
MELNRRGLAVSTLFVAVLLISSSLIGNFLLAKDASAGGMDVEWRVPLPDGYKQMQQAPDGSFVVSDDEGPILDVDRNGTVRWTYNSSHAESVIIGETGLIYFIDRNNDQDTVVCLHPNGTESWDLVSDVPVSEIRLGHNGDIYLTELRNNYTCLICLNGAGFYKWMFAPEGGVGMFLVLNDGTAIVRNVMMVWNITQNGMGEYVRAVDNLTAISNGGSILWSIDLMADTYPFEFCRGPYLGPNSTIDLYLSSSNGTTDIRELDRDGRSVPVEQGSQFTRYSSTQGNVVYVIDVRSDVSQVTSWNLTTGSLIWKMEEGGLLSITELPYGKGTVLQTNGNRTLIDSTGEAVWNITGVPDKWELLDYNEDGLLLSDGKGTIGRIDSSGGVIWEFGLDSSVNAGSLGLDGRVIVLTDDYLISIHRPVLSTTMNYFIVLLAIDLFITLMILVRTIDMLWPMSRAKIE